MPLPNLTQGDEGPLAAWVPGPTVSDMPALSGTEIKVKLVTTPTGIALISEDGQQITERRTLTQEDLRKVPPGLDVYRFVNLRARSGEIYSCIIAGRCGSLWKHARLLVVTSKGVGSYDRRERPNDTDDAYRSRACSRIGSPHVGYGHRGSALNRQHARPYNAASQRPL